MFEPWDCLHTSAALADLSKEYDKSKREGALFLLLLGRSRFTRLIRWLMTKLRQLSRLAGLFALVFGAFLVYAFF